METSNTSISGVRTDLLIPESDTSTCTMIVMERRPNALEKYERLESKSDGYCQKSFYRQQLDDRKTKKLTKTYKAMHSNNTTVQNPKKPAQPAQKAQEPPERPETQKRGLFHFPIFRITCIIRKIVKIKNRGPPSPAFRHRCRFWEPLLFFYIISFGTRGSPAKQAS